MPVSASRPATRLANGRVDDLPGADVDRQVGTGEGQVASPPAGELGEPVAQDRLADVPDQTGLFGQREELLRTEQPTLGVQPAGQRLEADDVSGRQLDDRLVVRDDLTSVDPPA